MPTISAGCRSAGKFRTATDGSVVLDKEAKTGEVTREHRLKC
jgi:hypothetical protein